MGFGSYFAGIGRALAGRSENARPAAGVDLAHGRAGGQQPPNSTQRAGSEEPNFLWTGVTLLVSLVLIPVAIGVAFLLLDLTDGGSEPAITLPVLLIVSIVGLIGTLATLVVIFFRSGMFDKTEALGFPRGSIRALIALMIIVLFAIVAIFLFNQVRNGTTIENVTDAQLEALIDQGRVLSAVPAEEGDRFTVTVESSDAAENFANQLLTTLSTLVVALAAFYFGNRSVKEAVEALSEVFGIDPEGPEDVAPDETLRVSGMPGDAISVSAVDRATGKRADSSFRFDNRGGGIWEVTPKEAGEYTVTFRRRGEDRQLQLNVADEGGELTQEAVTEEPVVAEPPVVAATDVEPGESALDEALNDPRLGEGEDGEVEGDPPPER